MQVCVHRVLADLDVKGRVGGGKGLSQLLAFDFARLVECFEMFVRHVKETSEGIEIFPKFFWNIFLGFVIEVMGNSSPSFHCNCSYLNFEWKASNFSIPWPRIARLHSHHKMERHVAERTRIISLYFVIF